MKTFNKLVLSSVFIATTAFAQEKGPLTPTSVTYTFNSAQLTKFDGANWGLFTTPMSHTFRKSDPDFANVDLKDVVIGWGRYKSISLCYDTDVLLTIDGAKYKGRSGATLNRDDVVYGQANGTVSTVQPGSVQNIPVSLSSDSQNCTTTYFKNPLCVVGPDQANECEVGDDIYASEGKLNPMTGELDLGLGAPIKLQISFLMDMLNGVIINADTGAVTTAPAVRIVMGAPGAAIHLGKWDNDGSTDVSMIFSNDKTLLSSYSTEYPGTHAPGFCSGQSSAYVSSVPVNSSLPTNSINFITFFDDLTGEAAYPVTASCPDANNCDPVGFNVFDNVIQEVASAASVNCVDQNSASVPLELLGYGYGSVGAGEAGGPQSLVVQRIVDPTNLFNICTAMSTGHIAGKTGVCAHADADADGY